MADVDTLPLIQAIESLKSEKAKFLEDKLEFLNQRISLESQKLGTAIANLDMRLRGIENFINQVNLQAQKQQKLTQTPPKKDGE